MTKNCSKAQVGISGLLIGKINARGKDKTYLWGIPISRDIEGNHSVETSSYAGEVRAAFYGLDTARLLKSLVS